MIAIYGNGGHGREVASDIDGLCEYIFVDDRADFAVTFETLVRMKNKVDSVIIAVGDQDARERIYKRLVSHGFVVATYISKSATVSKSARIGRGSTIMANSYVGADVVIGECTIVNVCTSVCHDSIVGNFVNISPNCGISGNVSIGDRAFIGTGVSVRNGINIGAGSVVGVGSAVVKNVPENITVAGCPAEPLTNGNLSK